MPEQKNPSKKRPIGKTLPPASKLAEVAHNTMIGAGQSTELKRLHVEYMTDVKTAISYAKFFRDVVLPVGMNELTRRYPIR